MLRFKNVIDTIDGHTAGEPVRLVISGLPTLKGNSMAACLRLREGFFL